MNHLGDANKMINDTPRTDDGLEYDDTTVDDVKDFARKLERELTAANDRINKLEEENDSMRADLLLWREDKWRE
jgi:predicted  nucleic acid-binding Zn-ribbon protein